MNVHPLKSAVLALLLLALVSCNATKTTTVADTQGSANSDSIVFLVFRITHDSMLGETDLVLTKKTRVAGKMKSANDDGKRTENFLTIEQFEGEELVSTTTIEHPLYKRVEYADDAGALRSKDLKLDSAGFFIRLQVRQRGGLVKISETMHDNTKRELITIPL